MLRCQSIDLSVIAGAALDTDDSLKPSLAPEGQSKMHLPSTVWKQPKDTKDWGDEYISKEQPERGKDMGQSRYSSADNIICEPSLAGKEQKTLAREAQSWCELAGDQHPWRETHRPVSAAGGGNLSGPHTPRSLAFVFVGLCGCQNHSVARTVLLLSKTCQVQNTYGIAAV